MYIYYALINALSAHIMHINLNIILYTRVQHSPTPKNKIKKQRKKQPKYFFYAFFIVMVSFVFAQSGQKLVLS